MAYQGLLLLAEFRVPQLREKAITCQLSGTNQTCEHWINKTIPLSCFFLPPGNVKYPNTKTTAPGDKSIKKENKRNIVYKSDRSVIYVY